MKTTKLEAQTRSQSGRSFAEITRAVAHRNLSALRSKARLAGEIALVALDERSRSAANRVRQRYFRAAVLVQVSQEPVEYAFGRGRLMEGITA